MKASDYKEGIPMLDESDYDKSLEKLIWEYVHGDEDNPAYDEPYEGAGYCVCFGCQVLAPLAAAVDLDLAKANARIEELDAAVRQSESPGPWTNIDPERPETMPEPGGFFMISFRDKDGECFVMGAYHYHDNEWYYHNDTDEIVELYDTVYAYQPWPDPAPYPGE